MFALFRQYGLLYICILQLLALFPSSLPALIPDRHAAEQPEASQVAPTRLQSHDFFERLMCFGMALLMIAKIRHVSRPFGGYHHEINERRRI